MVLNIIYLIVGLGLILWGANALTDGSAAIAKKWGVSDLVIGLTVVAFGTSAPELTISLLSSLHGNAPMAIGNVVGSNIFNVLVIIGVTALVTPIKIEKSIMTSEIPLVLLSSIALLVMANGPLLDSASSSVLTRVDGLILLLFFAIFMRYTFSQASASADSSDPSAENAKSKQDMPLWKSVLFVILGLGALVGGGDRFVAGASGIASAIGISDAVIGLTIVAAGTSLPELATSVAAALKGKTGIALGNVIGSNIFNIFLVLGASASITPLPFGSINNIDLLVLTGACLLFWLFGWFFRERTITRIEGGIMTACYIGYVSFLIYMI